MVKMAYRIWCGNFVKLASLSLAAALGGCVIHAPPAPNDPYYAPVLSTNPIPDQPVNGSLYRENVALNLFGDRKASRVGDIITVILEERTSSSKSATVEVTKESETATVAENGGTVFGLTPSIGNVNLGVNLGSDREFTGESEADQSNQLTGSISVTVTDIYPNGTLVVRGEKWITLNKGEEFIRISGIVRPDDVSPENTVMSTKIANARIQYSGTGQLAEAQEMGWLTRFFNSSVWPF